MKKKFIVFIACMLVLSACRSETEEGAEASAAIITRDSDVEEVVDILNDNIPVYGEYEVMTTDVSDERAFIKNTSEEAEAIGLTIYLYKEDEKTEYIDIRTLEGTDEVYSTCVADLLHGMGVEAETCEHILADLFEAAETAGFAVNEEISDIILSLQLQGNRADFMVSYIE